MSVEMIDRVIHAESGPVSAAIGGAGPDLVLLHSLLTNRHVFDRVLPGLAEHYRIHVVDLPGFGATAPVGEDILEFGGTIAAYVEATDLDRPATILGNGLGAFVALGALVTDQGLFGDVVLAGAGASFPADARPAFQHMTDRVNDGGMAAVVDIAVRRIFTEEYLETHPDALAERRQVLLQTPPSAFATACAALAGMDLVDEVAGIANRTLIMTGSADAATPPAMGVELARLMPNATFCELPGIAHGPQLQDPGGFLDVVLTFLDPEG